MPRLPVPPPDEPKPPAGPAPPPFRSRRDVSEALMESRRRQAMIQAELTTAIQRAHEQDSNIEILEVVAALLATVDRWLKREMADD